MGKPMRIRARAEDDVVEVKILISHIVGAAFAEDQEGGLVPAHFIQLVTVTHQGRNVLSAQWGPAVSANPYMSFKFRGGRQGEKVTVKWTDNLGDGGDETVIVNAPRHDRRATASLCTFELDQSFVSTGKLMRFAAGCVAGALLGLALPLCADTSAQGEKALDEIHKYRQMLEEGNPAELAQREAGGSCGHARGAKQAHTRALRSWTGPRQAGGSLRAAAALLRRYRQGAGCGIATGDLHDDAAGLSYEEATKGWYKPDSDIEALVTYVAGKSKGARIDVPAAHPKEAEMAAVGEAIFCALRSAGFLLRHLPLARRIGAFACKSCRIFTSRRRANAMTQWPAYRVSQGAVWTMERRLIDCIRQMRWPEPELSVGRLVALQVYLQKQANGGVMEAPGIKR